MRTSELTTPALLVNARGLEANIRTMADALPGERLRPHDVHALLVYDS